MSFPILAAVAVALLLSYFCLAMLGDKPPHSDPTGIVDLARIIFFSERGLPDFVAARTRVLGPVFRFTNLLTGATQITIVSDPEIQKQVIGQERKADLRPAFPSSVPMLHGDDMQLMSFDRHKIWRRMFGRVVTPEALKKFVDIILKEVGIMISRITKQDKPVALLEELRITQLKTMGTLLFGFNFESQEMRDSFECLCKDFELEIKGLFAPTWTATFKEAQKASFRSRTWLREKFESVMNRDKRKTNPQEAQKTLDDEKNSRSGLQNAMEIISSALLESSQSPPKEDIETAVDNLYLLLEASHSTSIHITTAVIGFLHKPSNVEVLRRVKEEVTGLKKFTYETEREEMPITQGCVMETMRLAPVVASVLYQYPKGIKLQVGRYSLSGPGVVLLDSGSNYMDPNLFPEPEKFLPERWIPGHKYYASARARQAFNPFGFGSHLCMGYKLAYLNIKATIYSILTRKIEVELAEPMVVQRNLFPSFIVRNGLRLRFKENANQRLKAS